MTTPWFVGDISRYWNPDESATFSKKPKKKRVERLRNNRLSNKRQGMGDFGEIRHFYEIPDETYLAHSASPPFDDTLIGPLSRSATIIITAFKSNRKKKRQTFNGLPPRSRFKRGDRYRYASTKPCWASAERRLRNSTLFLSVKCRKQG